MKARIYALSSTVIDLILGLISFFLVLRLFFKFFSTNSLTPFVAWIYSMSDFLISPFANIYPNLSTQTGVLDVVAIVTLVIYLMAGYLLLSIISTLSQPEIMEEEEPQLVHYHEVERHKSRKRTG